MPESTRGVAASSLGILSYNSVIRSHSAAAISGCVRTYHAEPRGSKTVQSVVCTPVRNWLQRCSVSIRGSQRAVPAVPHSV